MAEATRRAPNLTRPTWILAERQTKCRGRRGRSWRQPDGNFSATLFLRPKCSPGQAAQRSFVAALALYFTLKDLPGLDDLALKWPNDVLLRDGKVAGILLESASSGTKAVDWLTIGFGVNLLNAPRTETLEKGAVAPTSIVTAGGAPLSPAAFLSILAPHFHHWNTQLETHGFEVIRRVWLDNAARIGEVITARTSSQTVTGVFETIDVDGNLVLKSDGLQQVIPAADVYF